MKPVPILFLAALFLLPAMRAESAYDFSDSAAGFSMQVPDDWQPLADPQAADLVSLLSPTPAYRCVGGFAPAHATEDLPAVIVQETAYPDQATHDSFSPSQVQAIAAEMSQLQAVQLFSAATPAVPPLVPSMSRSATCFSNPPGFVIDTRTRDKFRIHTVVFLGRDRMVLLHCLSDDGAYARYRPAFDSIATSFSFHYFHQSSLVSHFSGMSAFDYFVVTLLIVLLLASLGWIFHWVYRRSKWDNV